MLVKSSSCRLEVFLSNRLSWLVYCIQSVVSRVRNLLMIKAVSSLSNAFALKIHKLMQYSLLRMITELSRPTEKH